MEIILRERENKQRIMMEITNRVSDGNHLTRVGVKVTIHCNCSFLKQLLYQLFHLQISSIVFYHGGYDDDWDDDYNDDDDNADDDMKYDDDFVLDTNLKD